MPHIDDGRWYSLTPEPTHLKRSAVTVLRRCSSADKSKEETNTERRKLFREILMWRATDIEKIGLPHVPKKEWPRKSLGNAWCISNQAVRQLANVPRHHPRKRTFPIGYGLHSTSLPSMRREFSSSFSTNTSYLQNQIQNELHNRSGSAMYRNKTWDPSQTQYGRMRSHTVSDVPLYKVTHQRNERKVAFCDTIKA